MRFLSIFLALLLAFSGLGMVLTAPPAAALVDGDWTYDNHAGNAWVTGYTGSGGAITMPSTLGGLPVTQIDDWALNGNTNIASLVLPNSVTVIHQYALSQMSLMATCSLSSALTALDTGAFELSTALTSISIPDSVTTIGAYAFSRCSDLTSITIGTGVTTIGTYAFKNCVSLASMTFYGLTAPGAVGVNWISGASASVLGHAYAASTFPSPGSTWNGLMMGSVIPVYEPPVVQSAEAGYELFNGSTYNLTVYPIVYDLNATHALLLIEFDTWSGVENVSLYKNGWAYLGLSPYCNSTVEDNHYLNMTGVVWPVTYRCWFSTPVNRTSEVYIAIYVASTGIGLPFETFHIRYSTNATYDDGNASDLTASNVVLQFNRTYTFAVFDFFGNVVSTYSFITSSYNIYISIPVAVYSLKVFNQQSDFTKIRIYYPGATAPVTYYAAPNEVVETWVRNSTYSMGVTMYSNHTALSTKWFNLTVTDAEFVLIQGYTISHVISDIEGVYALQTIITTMVTPDVVLYGEGMPKVPDEEIIYIHPWSVVAATVDTHGNNSTSSSLWLPHPGTAGSTYVVSQDRLYLSGNWSTDIWVNHSTGANYYNGTTLPSYLVLGGGNYTLVTSANVTWDRHTEWREETLFYYLYFTTQKKYEVTLTLNNSMAAGYNWTDINWLIGLPEGMTISPSSIKVYDLDNALYLVAGQNYDVSTTGVKMNFGWLNSSQARHFTLTMYDANASGTGMAIAYTDDYDSVTYNGEAYYKATASWTNGYGVEYDGQVSINLDFTNGYQRYIDPSTLEIYDSSAGRYLDNWEYAMSEGLIIVDYAVIGIGEKQSYDIYFLVDMAESGQFDINGESFIAGISWLTIFVGVVISLGVVSWMFKSRLGLIITVMMLCLTMLAFYFGGGF